MAKCMWEYLKKNGWQEIKQIFRQLCWESFLCEGMQRFKVVAAERIKDHEKYFLKDTHFHI